MTNQNEIQKKSEKQKDACYPRSEIAMRYYKTKNPKYAGNYLSIVIKRIAPEKHKLIYDKNSPLWVSNNVFTQDQVDLIEKVMNSVNDVYTYQYDIKVYEKIRVRKLRFAQILFENLMPEVALRRMLLILDKNYHIINKIFKSKEDIESIWMNLKQAYDIAKLINNEAALHWIEVEARRHTRKDLWELQPDWFDDGPRKSMIYELYTNVSNPEYGRDIFISMLKAIPGAYEAVYEKPVNKFKRCFSVGQMREIEKYLGKK